MYVVKRIYGRHQDYLMAWDKVYGTSCIGSLELAMPFQFLSDAMTAARRANETCKGANNAAKPDDMNFEATYIV